MRDNFTRDTTFKLAERAGYICSNPLCNRLTVGPSISDNQSSIKTGIAAHICAASPGGPRYDMSQSKQERESIKNGIWLCATCSVLIDKNNGYDYPADHLRKWKKDHEGLIKICLEGGRRVMMQFVAHDTLEVESRLIVKYLEQRGALFMDFHHEVTYYVFDSIKEIRTFLTQTIVNIKPDTPLEIIVDSMNNACRHFMNTTNPSMTMREMEYSLGALRKIIGLNLLDLQKHYKIQIKGDLESILPRE
jgi:hypothetical protein